MNYTFTFYTKEKTENFELSCENVKFIRDYNADKTRDEVYFVEDTDDLENKEGLYLLNQKLTEIEGDFGLKCEIFDEGKNSLMLIANLTKVQNFIFRGEINPDREDRNFVFSRRLEIY